VGLEPGLFISFYSCPSILQDLTLVDGLFSSVGDVERMGGSSDLSPELRLSLDDRSFLSEDSGASTGGFSVRLNRSFSSWTLFNRSSSICTDSSDDLASLGGGETLTSADAERVGEGLFRRLEYGVVHKDIGRIVDYFERCTRGAPAAANPAATNEPPHLDSKEVISNIHPISILYPSNIHPIFIQNLSNIHTIFIQNLSIFCSVFIQYPSIIHPLSIHYPSIIHPLSIQYSYNIYPISIQYWIDIV